ncbi:MAG: hypothetical protein IR527_01780 [Bacteroides sp.]|nr:MAG: hypothetical protein IR527_01780 [Bacteroides sp.]
MKLSINKLNKLHSIINVDIEIKDYYSKSINMLLQYGKSNNISGFRRGLIPIKYLKNVYGKKVIQNTILNMANEFVMKYLQNNSIKIIGYPLLNFDVKKYNWNFEDKFNLYYDIIYIPVIDIDKFKNNNIEYYNIVYHESTIKKYVIFLHQKNSNYKLHNKIDKSCKIDISLEAINNSEIKIDHFIYYDFIYNQEIKKILFNKSVNDTIKINIKDFFSNFMYEKICAFFKSNNVINNQDIFLLRIKKISLIDNFEINESFINKIFPGKNINNELNFYKEIEISLKKISEEQSIKNLLNSYYLHMINILDLKLPLSVVQKMIDNYYGINQANSYQYLMDIYYKILNNIIKEIITNYCNNNKIKNVCDDNLLTDFIIQNNNVNKIDVDYINFQNIL